MTGHQHSIGPEPCPVCAAVQAVVAERYSGPVRPPRDQATPAEIAARLALLAELPHDEDDPA